MGPIEEQLSADHRQLDELLARCVDSSGTINREAYDALRAGLLRHIGIEEKILLREARAARGGVTLPMAAQLRIEHGAIASLLVPTPTAAIVAELRALLGSHNRLEEGEAGLYAECDRLLARRAGEILARIAAAPAVPLAAHFDGPGVHRTAAAALEASRQARRRD